LFVTPSWCFVVVVLLLIPDPEGKRNFRNTLAALGWKQTEPSPLLSDSKGA
jgi:hypothetical protein